MAQTLGGVERKIKSATELQSIVQNMKTLAAVNVGIYEKSDQALNDYWQAIELGLIAILDYSGKDTTIAATQQKQDGIGVLVFGSDLGMVGAFNEYLVPKVIEQVEKENKKKIWPVGERIALKLKEKLPIDKIYEVPESAKGITELVSRLIIDIVEAKEAGKFTKLVMIYNKPVSAAAHQSLVHQLLPIDPDWISKLVQKSWPTSLIPQLLPDSQEATRLFFEEYLFITMCRACADSLLSENISRLQAMQRAEKNIDSLLNILHTDYNQARQTSITEELFDIIFGYDALKDKNSVR